MRAFALPTVRRRARHGFALAGAIPLLLVATAASADADPVIRYFQQSATVCQSPPQDGSEYRVKAGATIAEFTEQSTDASGAAVTCATLRSLTPDTDYTAEVQRRASGSQSTWVTTSTLPFRTHPSGRGVFAITATSAKVCDTAYGPGPVERRARIGDQVSGYRVLDLGTGGPSTHGCAEFSGLQPGTDHEALLESKTPASAEWSSGPTDRFPFRTLPSAAGPVDCSTVSGERQQEVRFGLKGSVTLKAPARGAFALAGSLRSEFGSPSGCLNGDLTVAPARVNLTALGFLPVTATVQLAPTERVEGRLLDGRLTAAAKVRVKVPTVTSFGLRIGGGSSCQSRDVSSIELDSGAAPFTLDQGGVVTGGFAIGTLAGCGALNSAFASTLAGKAHAISMELTPPPAA